MTWEAVMRFLAWLVFAVFTVWWMPKFILPSYRWVVFVLTCTATGVMLYLLILTLP